jgi:hypothetical protein
MAEPTPVEGIGITIFYSTTLTTYVGNSSWTAVEGIRDVTPPGSGKVDYKECTTQGTASTTKRKSYTTGLIDTPEWSFKQVYDKATYATMSALLRSKKGWKVVFADGGTYLCDAFIDEIKIESPMDGFNEVEYSLKVFGAESFATTS